MDRGSEFKRLEHQLELADRAIPLIRDSATFDRLQGLACEIRARLARLRAASLEAETSRRAYELWEEAGRPSGRDLEFWLRAELEVLRRENCPDRKERQPF